MKRSRLRRSSPEKVVAWHRRSKRLTAGKSSSPDYDAARAEVMRRSQGWCEAHPPACPSGRHAGVHAHHRRLRSQRGQDTPSNLLWVGLAGHDWAHSHPVEAHTRGLILWTGDDAR